MNEFIIFDTEYTAWKGSMLGGWSAKGEHKEIIQIGAVRVNREGLITDKFNTYVKPEINVLLSDYISTLTGISQETIDRLGVTLPLALEKFDYFCKGENKLLAISNGGDEKIIYKNLELIKKNYDFKNISFYDLQKILKKTIINSNIHIPIEKLSNDLGISTRLHCALEDSQTILKIIKKMNLLPTLHKIRF